VVGVGRICERRDGDGDVVNELNEVSHDDGDGDDGVLLV